ncbi:hypothetical protein DFH06DRAFT_195893 [Mycena polygramma]|nr:hypothetical protein DFH06DRAFT_195893 [Mycena polygramma]
MFEKIMIFLPRAFFSLLRRRRRFLGLLFVPLMLTAPRSKCDSRHMPMLDSKDFLALRAIYATWDGRRWFRGRFMHFYGPR